MPRLGRMGRSLWFMWTVLWTQFKDCMAWQMGDGTWENMRNAFEDIKLHISHRFNHRKPVGLNSRKFKKRWVVHIYWQISSCLYVKAEKRNNIHWITSYIRNSNTLRRRISQAPNLYSSSLLLKYRSRWQGWSVRKHALSNRFLLSVCFDTIARFLLSADAIWEFESVTYPTSSCGEAGFATLC